MESFAEKIAKSIGTPLSILIHTVAFLVILAFGLFGVDWNTVLLILTTLLSVEAIYLGLFNQMVTNKVINEKPAAK